MIANHRRRKKQVDLLVGPDGPVESTSDMMDIVVDYYKTLFGKEYTLDISLDEDFWTLLKDSV